MKKTLLILLTAIVASSCGGKDDANHDSGFFCGTVTYMHGAYKLFDCSTGEIATISPESKDYDKFLDAIEDVDKEQSTYVQFFGTVTKKELDGLEGIPLIESISVDKMIDCFSGITCNPATMLSKKPFRADRDTIYLKSNYTYIRWKESRENIVYGKWIKTNSDRIEIYPDNSSDKECFDIVMSPTPNYNGIVLRKDSNDTDYYPI